MEKDLVKAFQFNDEHVLRNLYKSYKSSFISFSRSYNLEAGEVDDVFQEAFIILRNHALSGKLSGVNSSMKTYLFGIAKNLIFNSLKKSAQTVYLADDGLPQMALEEHDLQQHELSDQQKHLRHFFNLLGDKCKDVLTLFYYRGLTNEEIAAYRNYENEAVVRSQKSRCLKTLKELIKQGNKN